MAAEPALIFTEEEEDTQPNSPGLDRFLRDQSKVVQDNDTASVCPVQGCDGGEIRRTKQTGTIYTVMIDTCTFCEGLGVVPIWKAAQYRSPEKESWET
jgi:hypothetical protein